MSTTIEKAKLTVGMKLYSDEKAIPEYTVTKVGKKYFETDLSRNRFFIETLKSDSSFRTITLYANRQYLLEKRESNELYDKIKNAFSHWNNNGKFSLEQLRQINSIIEAK